MRWSAKTPDCSEWLTIAVSTRRRAGRQGLNSSAGIGPKVLDVMGAFIMMSRTCLCVKTANSDKVEWVVSSGNGFAGLGPAGFKRLLNLHNFVKKGYKIIC